MDKKHINSVEKMSEYELELERVIKEIKKNKAKSVLLQFPDGMKNMAADIAKVIEKNTKANIMIWLGSCFGACDVPNVKVDLLVQWGHSAWTL